MPDHRVSDERHAAIFGAPDPIDSNGPGRSRKCKVCGGWHRTDRPWPHNCRPEAPPRADFATPMVAPPFEAFRTFPTEEGVNIMNRGDKREYMKKNGLVEYDAGVEKQRTPEWIETRRHEADVVSDLKRFHETDPLNLSPDLKAQRMDEGGSLDKGTEIDAKDIEVIK